uniref:Uncharacterized protein n=1 Tax=Oryza nivara TaxID=4536 RepID=A0A0E0IX83_ORYNI
MRWMREWRSPPAQNSMTTQENHARRRPSSRCHRAASRPGGGQGERGRRRCRARGFTASRSPTLAGAPTASSAAPRTLPRRPHPRRRTPLSSDEEKATPPLH